MRFDATTDMVNALACCHVVTCTCATRCTCVRVTSAHRLVVKRLVRAYANVKAVRPYIHISHLNFSIVGLFVSFILPTSCGMM